ncbi:MAG: hypothetical protein C6W54_17740 [Bacillaceae bacterium]|nr:MAG: hypothetical protein C6W54_17740 [Bacillaceae bacterium]
MISLEFIYYEAQKGVPLISLKTSYEWHKGIFVCFLKMVINVMKFTHLQYIKTSLSFDCIFIEILMSCFKDLRDLLFHQSGVLVYH